jgi:NMD protein affecting ribosome stability and mRNA decay
MINFICKNCGDTCPAGTLDNGLCSQCDLIGKKITVLWGRFGLQKCLAQKVSRSGRLYASRWNKKMQEWTSPRPIEQRRGYWILK